MDNQNANAFISNANFTEENNLVQLLESSNDFENITDVKLSPYVDIETLKENLYESKSNLSILSINTQSINAKFDKFKIAIEQLSYKHPVHIICVQETWIDSNCNTCMFELPNYQLISRGKYCSNHGGLFTYVHDDFYWEPMEIKEYSSGWENLFVKIQRKSKNSKKYIVGNIYRLPNELVSDITTFNEEFAETLDILHTKRTPTYLCGDFNIDLLKIHQKPNYCTFYDNLISSGYLPRISLPTRLTDHSATLIDNIFSTVLDDHKSGVIVNTISDHQMIYTYSIEKTYTPKVKRTIEIENATPTAMEAFAKKFQSSNITEQLDLSENANPNDNFELFMNRFTTLKQQCIPKKTVRYNKKVHKDNPWITNGILKSINSKDKLYKALIKTPKESPNYAVLQTNFKTYRKIIRRSIMFAKRDYYRSVFNKYSANLKMTWQTINETLNRRKKKREYPQEFKLSNGKTIYDPKQIADAFNNYFISIGSADKQTTTQNKEYTSYLCDKLNTKLVFNAITEESVLHIINSLKPKTSTGVDGISNKLLKFVKCGIAKPLTIIINQMLSVGIFPDLLKISKVIPLYKKDDPVNFSNYRPISLLPSISKIFEKVIFKQLADYLEENNLMYKYQYGFRKYHSTEYAALHLLDYLNSEVDARRIPLNVYLDLSKAFDFLSHSILLDKLKHYGVEGVAHDLLKNYLENRKQFVQLNDHSSELKCVLNGVPQGSILGPLLFLIYINDIPNSSNVFNFLLYADDTTLFCNLEDIDSDYKEFTLNQELQHVHEWLLANGLQLNVKKTKYMLFHKQNKIINKLNLRINNNIINETDKFNFLGLHINSRLTWDSHIKEVSTKIIRTTGIIKKLQLTFPKNILLSIYNSLILPHINYCILSWGYNSNKIFMLQKRRLEQLILPGTMRTPSHYLSYTIY